MAYDVYADDQYWQDLGYDIRTVTTTDPSGFGTPVGPILSDTHFNLITTDETTSSIYFELTESTSVTFTITSDDYYTEISRYEDFPFGPEIALWIYPNVPGTAFSPTVHTDTITLSLQPGYYVIAIGNMLGIETASISIDIVNSLFTLGKDTVDFNNLTESQLALIKNAVGGSALYKALGGDDVVYLPNESAYQLTPTTTWDPTKVFEAGEGNDTVTGGDGSDKISGGEGDDKFDGGDHSDIIRGDIGKDELFGGEGADVLDGGADADTIHGGSGIDIVTYAFGTSGIGLKLGTDGIAFGDAVGDVIGDDVEAILGSNFDDQISLGNQTKVVVGGGGSDQIWGSDQGDILYGDFVGLLDNPALFTLIGGAGAGGTAGNDHIYGGLGADKIYGGSGDDTLYSNYSDENGLDAAGNELYGGDGRDDLRAVSFSGAVADILEGGAGLDTFFVDNGDRIKDLELSEKIYSVGNHTIDLIHTIADNNITKVNFFTANGSGGFTKVQTIELDGRFDPSAFRVKASTDSRFTEISLVSDTPPALEQQTFTDWMYTDAKKVHGEYLKVLAELSYDDVTVPAVLSFGERLIFSSEDEALGRVSSIFGAGAAKVLKEITSGYALTFARHIFGDLKDKPAETIIGAYAQDTAGIAGTLAGGPVAGFIAEATASVGQFIVSQYIDWFFEGLQQKLLHELPLSGDIYRRVQTGDDQANNLNGTDTMDRLVGLDGDDVLNGNGGDDILDGGSGNDQVFGGGGNDLLIAGSGAGRDLYDGGDGTDTITFASTTQGVSVNLAEGEADGSETDHDTIIAIENVIGGSGNDTLVGNGQDNRLEGAGGNDLVDGGGGSDTAILRGARADYKATRLGDGTVELLDLRAGADGKDQITGVEFFEFKDGTLTLEQLIGNSTPDNRPPVGQADTYAIKEDASAFFDVLANDADPDGDALTINLSSSMSNLGASIEVVNGTVRYTADSDMFDRLPRGGALDTFTYTITDAGGLTSDPVTVSVSVSEAGDNRIVRGTIKRDAFTDAAGKDTSYFARIGNDVVAGKDGSDILFGQLGNDTLDGGDGRDYLGGGLGNNVLTGGAGSDTFLFGFGKDRVTDFNPEEDVIRRPASAAFEAILDRFGQSDLANGLERHLSSRPSQYQFRDVDLNGDKSADAVAITLRGSPGSMILEDWTVEELMEQQYLTQSREVIGDWIA